MKSAPSSDFLAPGSDFLEPHVLWTKDLVLPLSQSYGASLLSWIQDKKKGKDDKRKERIRHTGVAFCHIFRVVM